MPVLKNTNSDSAALKESAVAHLRQPPTEQ